MELPDQVHAKRWEGHEVLDLSGQAVGTCVGIFADTDTGLAEWLLVDVEGAGRAFVPAIDVVEEGSRVRLPFPRDLVAGAPQVGDEAQLTKSEERTLYDHYGVPYSDDESASLLPEEASVEQSSADVSAPGTADTSVGTASSRRTPVAPPPPPMAPEALPAPVLAGSDERGRDSGSQLATAAPLAAIGGVAAVIWWVLHLREQRARRRRSLPARTERARRQLGKSSAAAAKEAGQTLAAWSAVAATLSEQARATAERTAEEAGRRGQSAAEVADRHRKQAAQEAGRRREQLAKQARERRKQLAKQADERRKQAAKATTTARRRQQAVAVSTTTAAHQLASTVTGAGRQAASTVSGVGQQVASTAGSRGRGTSPSLSGRSRSARRSAARRGRAASAGLTAATGALSYRAAEVTGAVADAPSAVAKRVRKTRRSVARTSFRILTAATAAAGYVLGARAGRERYEEITEVAEALAALPPVQAAAETVTDPDRREQAVDAVREQAARITPPSG